jgi:hypothetical protein
VAEVETGKWARGEIEVTIDGAVILSKKFKKEVQRYGKGLGSSNTCGKMQDTPRPLRASGFSSLSCSSKGERVSWNRPGR